MERQRFLAQASGPPWFTPAKHRNTPRPGMRTPGGDRRLVSFQQNKPDDIPLAHQSLLLTLAHPRNWLTTHASAYTQRKQRSLHLRNHTHTTLEPMNRDTSRSITQTQSSNAHSCEQSVEFKDLGREQSAHIHAKPLGHGNRGF